MYCLCKDCVHVDRYLDGQPFCTIGMYCGQDDDYCACSQSKTGEYVKTLDECTVEELIAEIVRRTNG